MTLMNKYNTQILSEEQDILKIKTDFISRNTVQTLLNIII